MATVEQNKRLVRRVFEEGMNQNKPQIYYEVIAADYVNHSLPAPQPGPPGLEMTARMFLDAFSDFVVHIDELIGEGNKVFSRGSFSGTHSGVFNGIPATGKHFTAGYIDEWVVKDGKLSENWVQLDMIGLLQQLGVVPQQTA